jgi:hypothetical protein
MKEGMCKGCSNLKSKLQWKFYEDDGVTRIDPPLKTPKPFCFEYGLHIEYVHAIHYGDDVCTRYYNNLMD